MNAGGYVETRGARLYYQDWGAGEPVLLLHGNAQSHRVFRWYLRQLSPLYRVLLMDSRGHGLSRHREGRREFSTADMAGDVAALLDSLQISRCAIIGFSDGANVALEFAARFPGRVRAVVSVSGNARPEGLIWPLRLFARGSTPPPGFWSGCPCRGRVCGAFSGKNGSWPPCCAARPSWEGGSWAVSEPRCCCWPGPMTWCAPPTPAGWPPPSRTAAWTCAPAAPTGRSSANGRTIWPVF